MLLLVEFLSRRGYLNRAQRPKDIADRPKFNADSPSLLHFQKFLHPAQAELFIKTSKIFHVFLFGIPTSLVWNSCFKAWHKVDAKICPSCPLGVLNETRRNNWELHWWQRERWCICLYPGDLNCAWSWRRSSWRSWLCMIFFVFCSPKVLSFRKAKPLQQIEKTSILYTSSLWQSRRKSASKSSKHMPQTCSQSVQSVQFVELCRIVKEWKCPLWHAIANSDKPSICLHCNIPPWDDHHHQCSHGSSQKANHTCNIFDLGCNRWKRCKCMEGQPEKGKHQTSTNWACLRHPKTKESKTFQLQDTQIAIIVSMVKQEILRKYRKYRRHWGSYQKRLQSIETMRLDTIDVWRNEKNDTTINRLIEKNMWQNTNFTKESRRSCKRFRLMSGGVCGVSRKGCVLRPDSIACDRHFLMCSISIARCFFLRVSPPSAVGSLIDGKNSWDSEAEAGSKHHSEIQAIYSNSKWICNVTTVSNSCTRLYLLEMKWPSPLE